MSRPVGIHLGEIANAIFSEASTRQKEPLRVLESRLKAGKITLEQALGASLELGLDANEGRLRRIEEKRRQLLAFRHAEGPGSTGASNSQGRRSMETQIALATGDMATRRDIQESNPATAKANSDPAFADGPEHALDIGRFFARYGMVAGDMADFWGQQHYAFGDANNPIQLASEMEARDIEVLTFYRPKDVKDDTWREMNPHDRARHIEKNGGPKWYDMRRMSSAPAFMHPELKKDGPAYEITTNGHVDTLSDLFGQAAFTQQAIDVDGGFHFHASFLPNAKYAKEISIFLAQTNEYFALRNFGRSPDAIHFERQRPYTAERLEKIESSLTDGRCVNDKLAAFSARAGDRVYGNNRRQGFEARATNKNVSEARRIFAVTVHFLSDPANARVKLGNQPVFGGTDFWLGQSYTMSDIAGVDRLGAHLLDRFSPAVKSFYERVSERPELRHDVEFGELKGTELATLWSLPMVEWEKRPYIPDAIKEKVLAEREKFVTALDALAAKYPPGSSTAGAQASIQSLVHEWCKATKLHEYQ
jgi:hypothetical protein